jgi:hypothetical protein
MTTIGPVGPAGAPRPTRRAGTTNRTDFAMPADAESAAAATDQAAAASAPAVLGSMLALQEFGGEQVQDRAARRRGQDLLGLLSELQRAMLAGADGAAVLARLAELAVDLPAAADERLTVMLSAIVLRARVELARQRR